MMEKSYIYVLRIWLINSIIDMIMWQIKKHLKINVSLVLREIMFI